MSLYWQQALPNGDHSQEAHHSTAQMHQQKTCIPGQWDYVSLGSVPAQAYQWSNYAQQSAPSASDGTCIEPLGDLYTTAAFGGYHQQLYSKPTGNNVQSEQSIRYYNNPKAQKDMEKHYYQQQNSSDIKTDQIPQVQDNKYQKVHHTPIVLKRQLKNSTESSVNNTENLSEVKKSTNEGRKISEQLERIRDDECWDDDWERAEPENEVVSSFHGVTPSNEANQTQSELTGYATRLGHYSHENSEALRTESELNSVDCYYQQQFSTTVPSHSVVSKPEELGHHDQLPAVAQVAPILKEQVLELEYPVAVARVEPVPVTQAINVQRVAPTLHASQDLEIVHPMDSVMQQQQQQQTVVIDVPILASASSNPTTEVVLPDTVKVSVACRTSASAGEDMSQVAIVEQCITPEMGRGEETESPGNAQATSTPIVHNEADGALKLSDTNLELHTMNSAVEMRSQLHPHSEAHPVATASADHSDSTQGSMSGMNGSVRKTVGNRCKVFKEQYSDIFGRLDQHRTDTVRSDFSAGSRMTNPLMGANVSANVNRRTILPTARNTTSSKDLSLDDGRTYHKCDMSAIEKLNISNYSQPPPSLERSIDISRGSVGYGDDFVDAARRSRLNRSRPASHAKSEVGEVGPYKGLLRSRPRSSMHGYSGHSGIHPQHYYPGYYSSLRDPMIMPHTDYYDQQQQYQMHMRRTQSTYDAPAYERFMRAGGRYGHYDAFNDGVAGSSVSDEGSGEDDEEYGRGECEEEVRRYTSQVHYGATPIMSSYSVNGGTMHMAPHTPGEEIYYFGAIHLDQDRVKSILYNCPPPPEYYTILTPIEKAAYLFYVSVYNKPYNNIRDFHNKFNREYYKFTCDGDTENMALWKICKSMKEEYYAKRLNCSQKAYEASQKQLFSDERDSIDGMSDRASVYDKDDDRTSDIMSIDSSQRAPLKHRTPHAFITFGPCGKMVTVHPDISVSVVQIDDVKNVLRDNYNQRIIDAIKMFRGPLIAGQTPTHSVRLYIQRQIERIRTCEVASENPKDNDVIDCLLIWQLLEMVVQQQGRITGPDIARLLVSASTSSACHSHHREKTASHLASNEIVTKPAFNSSDPQAFDRFTHYLLGGHIDEAVDCALRDGLYADAIVLARRLFTGDSKRLAQIEERFLATRPQCNPVMTLVSVASDQPAPILTNPPVDDTGSWRTHAAIVLANLSTPTAMNTVYHLGRVLAKREYHSAADFCFLSVALLAGYDPFQPVQSTEQESSVRQRIVLIHAGLPDDEWDSTQCRFGFSLSDLHATEIFDYAVRLAGGVSPLANSIDYQRRRIQYAVLMAEYGGFSVDSFRYCMEIARSIWGYYHMLKTDELRELCDLADRLKFVAAAEPSETAWIDSLRVMITQLMQSGSSVEILFQQNQKQSLVDKQWNSEASRVSPVIVDQGVHNQQPEVPRSRSESLAAEARDWHAERQDPLQMSPVTPVSSTIQVASVEPQQLTEFDGVRGRTDSIISHHSTRATSYGERLCKTQCQGQDLSEQLSPTSYPSYCSNSYGSEDSLTQSEQTSEQTTTESTPVRQKRQSIDVSASVTELQPASYGLHSLPMASIKSNLTTQSNQQVLSQQTCQDDPSSKIGLPTDNIKKSASGSKGFFGNMKDKLMKAIPSGNEMILPDDSKPTIVWDATKGKYVGSGVEEETTAAPPPKVDQIKQGHATMNSGGLQAARTSGGSRYFNPMNQASIGMAPSTPTPTPIIPAMPVPFGFIPTMPDDVDSVDPFSAQVNTVQDANNSEAN